MSTGPVVRLMAVCGYLVLLSPLAVVALLSVSSGAFLTFPPPGFSLRWFTALAGNADAWVGPGDKVTVLLRKVRDTSGSG